MSGLANIFLVAGFLALQFDYGVENTNIITCDEYGRLGDHNRLRADINLEHPELDGFTARLILDNETRYSEQPTSFTNKSKIYRAYLEYGGEKHFWVIGRQRVPFGVGRIWNPIDVFNPIDSLAVESGERTGTEALRYEYALGPLANFDITVSRDKSAARIKGYLEFVDLALVGVADNDNDRDIMGWEIEGELFATGIELRSEGGCFHNRVTGKRHTEFIYGVEYGFANSLTLLGEYYFNDKTRTDHLGCTISYQPASLWSMKLLKIINLDDHSSFIAPSIEYSLSDEMTISAGVFIYNGGSDDEFGLQADQFYLRWFVHF
ncbi:MAG: hypothetical protein KAI90_06645 [Desulfobulbaceae bacterium]|nr:hypothetical protein [Desulfobulbaceae bacterium]